MPTSNPQPAAEREVFDRAFAYAARLLADPPDDRWHRDVLMFIRGIESRELRHAALDGVMAALDEREATRP